MNWKTTFQKYGLLICLFCSLFLLMGAGGYLHLAKDKNVIVLTDMVGSSGSLEGFLVEGYLGDDYHAQKITIADGVLSHEYQNISIEDLEKNEEPLHGTFSFTIANQKEAKTTITPIAYPQLEFADYRNVLPTDEGYDVTVETDKVQLFAEISDWYVGNPARDVFFYTDIFMEQEDNHKTPFFLKNKILEGRNTTITDPVKAGGDEPERIGLAQTNINGKYYFTITVDEKYRGMDGIYRIDTYGDGWLMEDHEDSVLEQYLNSLYNRREVGKAVPIVNIPLDGDIQVLDLKGVGDKLVLLKGEGERLVAELYNENGQCLDRLIMPESMNTINLGEIQSYAVKKDNQSSFSFRTWYQRPGEENAYEAGAFASMVVDDKLHMNYYMEDFQDIRDVAQYDGRLLMISWDVAYLNPQMWQTQYETMELVVYEPTSDLRGKLVYRGKIIADNGDDCKKGLAKLYRYQPASGSQEKERNVFVDYGFKSVRGYSEFLIKGDEEDAGNR